MSQLVSPATIVTLIVGLVVAAIYLRYMWLALQKAVRTRDEADQGQDRFARSLIGAVVAVIGSSVAIAAYGAAPALLYLGPLLAIGSAIAVSWCLQEEVAE